VKHHLAFTTAYHTCFPEYVKPRFGVPLAWTYAWLRRFHGASSALLVATPAIREMLEARGFSNIADWSRGVDLELFRPGEHRFTDLRRPVFLYVGRVAVEKNLPAFLALDLPGTKLVVGDGPQRKELQQRFPDTAFVGMKSGPELASYFQRADVFVFPSRTDTFGLVLLEALASGLPIAGFPVAATRDVVGTAPVAALDEDLRSACLAALTIPRTACRRHAETATWEESARCFIGNLVRMPDLAVTATAKSAPRLLEPAASRGD
jgi:glycosyltransferase involved in cell wall biosynthesis